MHFFVTVDVGIGSGAFFVTVGIDTGSGAFFVFLPPAAAILPPISFTTPLTAVLIFLNISLLL